MVPAGGAFVNFHLESVSHWSGKTDRDRVNPWVTRRARSG